jgi:hypothetical protein
MQKKSIAYLLPHENMPSYLEKFFAEGWLVDGMFTMIENKEFAGPLAASPRLEQTALFAGAGYDHVLDASPILCRLEHGHALTDLLVKRPVEFGFFTLSSAQHHFVAAHWQGLLDVRMPDGTISHFRFYSAEIMHSFLPLCTEEEIAQLLGPCGGILIPAPANKWLYVEHPAMREMSSEELFELYKKNNEIE